MFQTLSAILLIILRRRIWAYLKIWVDLFDHNKNHHKINCTEDVIPYKANQNHDSAPYALLLYPNSLNNDRIHMHGHKPHHKHPQNKNKCRDKYRKLNKAPMIYTY